MSPEVAEGTADEAACSPGRSIETVYLHVTHACDLRCRYCYFAASKPAEGELTALELRELLRDIAGLGPQKLVFTGGEPLLREDLFEAAGAFRAADGGDTVHLCLMSNGTLIDEQASTTIAELFDEVRISIDAPEQVNDRLRGRGSFRMALAAMRQLTAAGLAPAASITVTSESLPYLSDFLAFLFDQEGITRLHLNPFRQIGRGANRTELSVSWRDTQQAVADFWLAHFGGPSRPPSTEPESLLSRGSCGVGRYVNVYPSGDIYPCHVLTAPQFLIGNVRESPLSVILSRSLLLAQLRGIDFRSLADQDAKLQRRLRSVMCAGEVTDLPASLDLGP